MTIAISGTTGITLDGQFNSASTFGFRNRIINGAMVINQRSFSGTATDGGYTLDRFAAASSQTGKFTVSQSSTSPSGFSNSLLATSSSAYSVGAGDFFAVDQFIEGFNTSDLAWGTANAATVTLSFRVYSSLTGTFGGAIINNAFNYSYPFSYSIPAANTWTTISITIAGPTAGTWVGATSGVGMRVYFGLGVGSTYSGTASSWASSLYFSVTGATSVVGTSGATFYITGVQLEKGSTATSFDYRPYGTELALCQRYFTSFVGPVAFSQYGIGEAVGTTKIRWPMQMPVTMRSTPTLSVNGSGLVWAVDRIGTVLSAFSLDYGSTQIQSISATTANGITIGQAGAISAGNYTNTSVTFSSEL